LAAPIHGLDRQRFPFTPRRVKRPRVIVAGCGICSRVVCLPRQDREDSQMSRGSRAAVIALLALLVCSTAARANQIVTVTIPATAGEVDSKWLSYPGPPRANVLLPTGYSPVKAYPLLVLLHGLQSNYDWYAANGIQQTMAGLDAIVVMPEGASGWYTDWWNDGERSNPSWESYELNEVLPYIRRHYRILRQRRYHAIAGISMGGLGATYLGGRLPGFFGSVATLSGFVDPQIYGVLISEGETLTSLAPLKGDLDFNAVEGPPNGFYATGHNPVALVENLLDTRLFVSTGTGVPTSAELGILGPALEGSLLEGGIIYPMNRAYGTALAAAGLNATYQAHAGGHDLPNFRNELEAMLAWGLFKRVASHPRSWVDQTVAAEGRLWDIAYRFATPPDAVVQFRQSARSLSVTAAGSNVTVTTSRGCTITTPTPATVRLPGHCGSRRRGRLRQAQSN
jgi:S-formylglutathione hydrolase FrmB